MFSVGALAASVSMGAGLRLRVVVVFCSGALEELVETGARALGGVSLVLSWVTGKGRTLLAVKRARLCSFNISAL